MKRTTMTARSRRVDWIETGIRILKEEGHRALTVDRLCRAMGKTKGSYYHHFQGHDRFVGDLLQYWEEVYTSGVVAAIGERSVAEMEKGEALLAATYEEALLVDLRLETAIRVWAHHDSRVHQVLQRVDRRRLRYLESVFSRATTAPGRARTLSRLSYAAFVGVHVLFGDVAPKTRREMGRVFRKGLLAAARDYDL